MDLDKAQPLPRQIITCHRREVVSLGLKEVTEIVKSEFVFGILFVLGLIIVGRHFINREKEQTEENKLREDKIFELYEKKDEEAQKREAELMLHQKDITEQLSQMNQTQSAIQENLTRLERQTEDNFREIWKQIRK